MSNKNGFKTFLYRTVVKMFRVTLVNPEKEPDPGVLLCSNHISNLDPVLIVSSLKNQPRFMAKKELFKIPVVGWFIKMFGAFPIERGSVDLTAMKKAICLLEEGYTVGLFPQGTRCAGKDPRKTKIKSGAGMIVTRAQNDILPVAIISKNNKAGLFNKKYIVLGDVIKFDTLNNTDKSREEFDRISKIIFDKICDLHEEYSYLTEKKK